MCRIAKQEKQVIIYDMKEESSPALLCGRDRAEANESADLADVKLPSPVLSRGSSLPPFCSRTQPRSKSATLEVIMQLKSYLG